MREQQVTVSSEEKNETFTIFNTDDFIWIERKEGEGMGVSEAKFYELLDKFYEETF